MYKLTLAFSILIANSLFCLSQKICLNDDLVRIEVIKGKFHSIILNEEGLFCKTVDENFNVSSIFFQIDKIDSDLLWKLCDYASLVHCCYMGNNIIIDEAGRVIRGSYDVIIRIEKNKNIMTIRWIDGDNKRISFLLEMVNDLIPIESREKYKILPP